jgi:hypothetical protein
MSVLPRRRVLPLHAAILRSALGALGEARESCSDCRRTPLPGERVHLYGDRLVCELCRGRRREAPERSEVIRSPEGARAVRLRGPSARLQ